MIALAAEPQRLTSHIANALAASGHRIVVTGAGGWLGLATLELLADALGPALAERVACFGARRRDLTLRDGTTIRQHPLAEIAALRAVPTLVLHLAFLTKDKVEGMDEAAYRAANRAIGETVLTNLERIGATGVFVASSGAARHADDGSAAPEMRLYGALKCQDEVDFAAWAQRHHRTAVVARIFNVSGPYINKHAAYAFAAFVLDALAGRSIDVRAPHRVYRGIVAIREVMSLVFAMLLVEDAAITRFDTGGARMELADLAAAVAAVIGRVAVSRAAIASDRVDDYVGDDARYGALLDRYAVERVSLDRQIADTAEFLIASQGAGG